jgi:sec-independent protein translocase protein TatB
MFDIGWPELMVIAVITLLVVGPKELPRVLRTFTMWVRRVREMASEFQSGLDDLAREAEIEDIQKELEESAPDNLLDEAKNSIASDLDLERNFDELDDILGEAETEKPAKRISKSDKPDTAEDGTEADADKPEKKEAGA